MKMRCVLGVAGLCVAGMLAASAGTLDLVVRGRAPEYAIVRMILSAVAIGVS